MKIAPKPKQGQEVSLEKLLSEVPEKPTTALIEEETAPIEPAVITQPVQPTLTLNLIDHYLQLFYVPVPSISTGRVSYQHIDIIIKPLLVSNLKEFMRLGQSSSIRVSQGLFAQARKKIKDWSQTRFPEGFMPASALTLYSIAKAMADNYSKLAVKRYGGDYCNPAKLFKEEYWKEGILTNSFIAQDLNGGNDTVWHADVWAHQPPVSLPEQFLATTRSGLKGYIDRTSRSGNFPAYSEAILGTIGGLGPASRLGNRLGDDPRICVCLELKSPKGHLVRIERMNKTPNIAQSGWVFGVRYH